MSNYFGAQPSSPFYAQQQQLPLHTNHGAPPPQQHPHQQQPSYVATSPVSAQSYSPSPPQQAPLRPHTAAPYAGSGFAPPPSAGPPGYYQQFPPQQQPQQQQQQQQQQQGYRPQQQQPQQATSDYGGPQQTQQPRNDYAPAPAAPAPPAPSAGYQSDIPHLASSHGVSPEVVQKLAADLMRSIQQSNISSPTVAPVGPPPRLDHPALPGGAPAPGMAQPPPQHPPMMQQQQPSQIHIPGSFPSYLPAPAPQEPPQVPHHQYRQQQQQQQQQPQGYPLQPQGYFPPQPIPTSNPPAAPTPTTADSKGPPPSGPAHPPMQQRQNDAPRRDTAQRYRSNTTSTHHSHTSTPATSTSSGPAGKDGSILYELWGDLVDQEPGREPMPKEKLVRLFRGIANHIIKERMPAESIVITPEKMVDFYAANAVEGDDRMDWKGYFNNRTDSSLSSIYRVLGCEHFYVPTSRDQKPTIPALTPQGFETWMFTQLMTHPSREAARIQRVVASWPIYDTKEGRNFPKSIPRRCFPEKEDSVIFQGWWRVWEEFPPDFEEEEEEQAPLTLPAPGDSSGNRYYGPPPLHGPLPGPAYAAAPMARKGTQTQKYPPNPRDLNDDELDAIIESGKDKSPPIERHRKPYASSTGNPGWKEELNPRPTLGEDKASSTRNGPPPPSRPHTSHGHHPSRDAREFREEPYAKPGPDRDPRNPRDPGDPRDPRNPRDPREPREPRDPRDPREPRDPRDLSDSPETPLGRSKSTRHGHQRERSQYRHGHRHSHSHHRGGGRRDRSADEHDPEWSGSSGVSAQTPISVPDAGVPIPGATPVPPPLEAQDRRSRAQRKADEAARVARQQEELLRGFGPSGRYEPPADTYEYDDFTAPPQNRGRERDDRRVAEYAYQDEYDRDRHVQQPGGGSGGRRSSHHVGDRGRARDRSSYWGP